ncbi:MAG: response regulator [Sphingobacteriaceae bacterium]|nr:response regulator [Sphingobacteriaceae bacterium]
MAKPKILVIEDDRDCLEIITYILEHDGYDVSGSLKAKAIKTARNFDLIILDEILVGERGSNICKTLKTNPETAHIPVILISALYQVGDIAGACQADAFLSKPFEIAVFEKLIKSVLRESRSDLVSTQ